MREIKFRAWETIAKFMATHEDFIETKIPYYQMIQAESYILMQYTGLSDKEGVEIYEGDILALSNTPPNRMIVSVVFEDACFVLNGTQTDFYGKTCLNKVAHEDEAYEASHYCEVIGNMYENPELLNENIKQER